MLKIDSKRIGYYLEWLAVKALKEKHGITKMVNTFESEREREVQLALVGLPIEQEVPVDEWLSALLKGYRSRVFGTKLSSRENILKTRVEAEAKGRTGVVKTLDSLLAEQERKEKDKQFELKSKFAWYLSH